MPRDNIPPGDNPEIVAEKARAAKARFHRAQQLTLADWPTASCPPDYKVDRTDYRKKAKRPRSRK